MICSIYKITNTINDKVYIGQTWKSIKERFCQHKSPNYKVCIKLHNALNKHGKENFSIQLITMCGTQESANYWEVYFIEKYKSTTHGYNLKSGGSYGKHSAETKRKISLHHIGHKYHLGYKHSEMSKLKMSLSNIGNKYCLGYKHSKETKANMAKSQIGNKNRVGYKASEETINKLSKRHKGKPWCKARR